MDLFLAILSGIFITVGIAGALLPILPGPPISWFGILLLHFSKYAHFSATFLVVTAVIMIAITVFDYYVPMWGTKKFGGTKAGITGSTVGMLVGLFFFPPLGIIFGPFVGAFLGEIIANKNDLNKAIKSAIGSFVGFLLGTGLKLIFAGFMSFYFLQALF